MDDDYALSLNSERKFIFLAAIADDDNGLGDSSDIYIYSLYLMLFDLELSRLFSFINRLLVQWINSCLDYLKFFNEVSLKLLLNNFEFTSQLRFFFKKKSSTDIIMRQSMYKIHLTNFMFSVVNDIEDLKNSDYDLGFLNRND